MTHEDYPNQTLQLLYERASCRSFTEEKIPPDILQQLLEAGIHSATGGNLQPYSIIKIEEQDLEKINYDALKIAEVELESGILPISINKPFPKKKEEELKKAKVKPMSDAEKEKLEVAEEEEIAKELKELKAMIK